MANDTTIEDVKHHNAHHEDDNAWNGGQEPFKASYGKLMMWYFLLSDAFTFAGFLIAYGALRFSLHGWPVPDAVFSTAPFGIHNAPLIFVTFMTFVLIVSSVTMLRAVQEGKHENKGGVIKWMVMTLIGGSIFLGCQAWEWTNLIVTEGATIYNNPFATHLEDGTYISLEEAKTLMPTATEGTLDLHGVEVPYVEYNGVQYFDKVDHYGKSYVGESFKEGDSYLVTYHGEYMPGVYKTAEGQVKVEPMGPKAFSSLFFFITGFHGFHVLSGLIIMLVVTLNSWSGFYVERRNGYEMVEKVGLYWHFVDLVWVFVFLVFYLI